MIALSTKAPVRWVPPWLAKESDPPAFMLRAGSVIDRAQVVAPGLDIVVRTHSEAERQFLMNRGVSEVVLGEWELALELTRHTLQGFGLAPYEIEAVVQATRQHGRVTPPGRPSGSEPADSPRPKPVVQIEPQ